MKLSNWILATSATALVLAACAAPTAVPGVNPAKTAAEVDAIVLTKDKPTEVVFWHQYSGAAITGVQEIISEFNGSNPYGIIVKQEKAGNSYNDVYNKINANIAAGTEPPALSQAYQNQAALYRDQGAMIDMKPFVESKKYGVSADDLKDIFPIFLKSDENPQFPGEILGWPTQRSLEVLYVNLDMLKANGYSAPPKTLKEMEEMACKASKPDQQIYGYAWRNDASQLASLIFAAGGNVLKPDATSYDLNSPAVVSVMEMLKRMFAQKCAVAIPAAERFGEQNRFGAGTLLFTQASSSGLPFYADVVKAGGKHQWTVVGVPQADPAKPGYNLYGASYSIYKTTRQKELASWLFMKYFTEKQNTLKWSTISNYLTVRQSAAQEAIAAAKASPRFVGYAAAADGYGALYGMVNAGKVESPVAGYDPVRDAMAKAVDTITVKGEGDIKTGLDALNAAANKLLAENAPKKK